MKFICISDSRRIKKEEKDTGHEMKEGGKGRVRKPNKQDEI